MIMLIARVTLSYPEFLDIFVFFPVLVTSLFDVISKVNKMQWICHENEQSHSCLNEETKE